MANEKKITEPTFKGKRKQIYFREEGGSLCDQVRKCMTRRWSDFFRAGSGNSCWAVRWKVPNCSRRDAESVLLPLLVWDSRKNSCSFLLCHTPSQWHKRGRFVCKRDCHAPSCCCSMYIRCFSTLCCFSYFFFPTSPGKCVEKNGREYFRLARSVEVGSTLALLVFVKQFLFAS